MTPLTCGSLFSGIGGLDLGLERAGMEVRWQVEIDPYCRRVLAKHWPNVARFEDVREVGAHNLEPVDVICGGFPCQDISLAGEGAGLDGERSGLWAEFARLVCELRPRYVVVENVAALTSRGLGRVLGDLAEAGYDAEWQVLRASDFGAEHARERLFVIAYPVCSRLPLGRYERAHFADARIFSAWSGPANGTAVSELGRCGASRWSGDVHGIPNRVDRIRALGNAVVPQVAHYIGCAVVQHYQSLSGAA